MKKLLFSFFILVATFGLQSIFSVTTAKAEGNSTEIFDGTNLSKSELESIRENEEYIIDLTYEQALERAAEVSGKSIEELKAQDNSSKLRSHPTGCGWMETSTTLTVKSYKPKLIVIVEACRNGSFGWITERKPLLQEFEASSKKFEGSIKVDLNSIGYEYVVNGSFYNSGIESHEGTVGANTIFTATYSVSSTNNFYGSLYTGLKSKQIIN